MSTNPFDDEDGTFVVVVNDEEQHSLWPTFADVPAAGRWYSVKPPARRVWKTSSSTGPTCGRKVSARRSRTAIAKNDS